MNPLRPLDTLIGNLIRMGLPYLPADEANEEIVRLTTRLLKLEGQIDAHNWKWEKETDNG